MQKRISVSCPVCGRTHIISNPQAIDNYEAGIEVVCSGCNPPEYVGDYHHHFHIGEKE